MLTNFTRLSRSVNVRRKLIPQRRSLVSEWILIISIIIGWLSEIGITVVVAQYTSFEQIRNIVRPISFYTFKKEDKRLIVLSIYVPVIACLQQTIWNYNLSCFRNLRGLLKHSSWQIQVSCYCYEADVWVGIVFQDYYCDGTWFITFSFSFKIS